MQLPANVQITWLGHSTFRVVSPNGKVILIDPWLEANPMCPSSEKIQPKCDYMLITHGHFDHMGDAVSTAKETGCTVVCIFEIANFMERNGITKVVGMNKGGTVHLDGINVTMTHAIHSSGILSADGQIIYGGDAAGYVVELENGFKFYHSGDSTVFGDMALIADLYEPELAMLPIGDHYTGSPKEMALAARLLKVKAVIPIHYGTFPVLVGTPSDLAERTKDIPGFEVVAMKPGETLKG